ncbi:hypothetical protein LINPERHAP1_LOCUS4498 [Linum perenne]
MNVLVLTILARGRSTIVTLRFKSMSLRVHSRSVLIRMRSKGWSLAGGWGWRPGRLSSGSRIVEPS